MTVGVPPLEIDTGFVVATGIECSAPVIEGGVRQDELRKTGHWERYREDLALVASFGIHYLRYGVPFHVVARDPDISRFDWDWTDRAMEALQAEGLEPILDLLHFGLPDDISGVGDPRMLPRYESYAAAVAERYPWVRYYTPVNEPFVTAWFSAKEGYWNERRHDDVSFVAALDNILHCVVRGMELISERRPDAIFIQSDACDSYTTTDPETEEHVRLLTERSWVGYDLTYGWEPTQRVLDCVVLARHDETAARVVRHSRHQRTLHHRARLLPGQRTGRRRRWSHTTSRACIAVDSRPWPSTFTTATGCRSCSRRPTWRVPALPDGWRRYWNDTIDLKDQGLPIRGFCWYGFVDHVDWDTALTRNRDKVNTCGLVGLDRQPHEVGHLYRQLAASGALASRGGMTNGIGRVRASS